MLDSWSSLSSVPFSGLPDDVSIQEMAASFGKCGIIRQGEDSVPKIKLYRQEYMLLRDF